MSERRHRTGRIVRPRAELHLPADVNAEDKHQLKAGTQLPVFCYNVLMEIEEIYREIAPKLQSYLTGNGCSYSTACDIVQETFLRLWKRREELSNDMHQVSGLAFTIARNFRNDLARKARHETLGGESSVEGDDFDSSVPKDEARPGEEAEETAALKRRLLNTLSRMPVQLLETFALSRLGNLTVKDIASGTGVSEANVKVRVHRARDFFKACFSERSAQVGGRIDSNGSKSAVLKAMMMLAAVDGEISREELSLYRSLAQEFRGEDAAAFDGLWERSVRAMAYIGFLTEMLRPDEIVLEYVRQVGCVSSQFVATLEQMASADGDYSRIERDCISALVNLS